MTEEEKAIKCMKSDYELAKEEDSIYTEHLGIILKLVEINDKIIDLMAEQLSTPLNSKEWVKEYYRKKVETSGNQNT